MATASSQASRAELEFTSEQSRWVSKEMWHLDQKGQVLEEGRYRLQVPFSNPTELAMDIMRHVPAVKVIAPQSLRERIRGLLEQGLSSL